MKKTFALTIVISMCAVYGAEASSIPFSDTAINAAGITTIRDAFRTAIGGGGVAGANGSFGGVRREINWDGVPDIFSAPNLMPPDFFNVNSPRGAVFSTPGSGFEVSANAGVAPIEFDNINPTYSSTFATFSPQRLFTAIGSNVTDVRFFVAGTNTPAVTSAFGAIFTDVDLAGSSLQFFDIFNNSLGTFAVPSLLGNQTFEFLGVIFDSPVINRVRITSGNSALGAAINDGAAIDLAVMDDFLYAEPQAAVPEPTSLLLLGAGLIAIRRYRARKA
jgi:PEP-CTERM motif-containing protein